MEREREAFRWPHTHVNIPQNHKAGEESVALASCASVVSKNKFSLAGVYRFGHRTVCAEPKSSHCARVSAHARCQSSSSFGLIAAALYMRAPAYYRFGLLIKTILALSSNEPRRKENKIAFVFVIAGKKKFSADPTCCPVCGITVRPQELEQHFLQELDRLYKLSSVSQRPRPRSTMPPQPPEHGQILHTPSAADGTPFGRWETYKRIKANRQARIRIKNRKRKADEPACPVCQERLSGTTEELNHHVERCLQKQNGGGPNPAVRHPIDEEEVDVEGDTETFEEYEWAGQRRVRASSMLMGGFAATGLATSSSSNRAGPNGVRNDEEDVDLVVDGDDQAQFGPSQYTEADVVTPRYEGSAREQREREALREAVISPNGTVQQSGQSSNQQQQQQTTVVEVKTEPSSASPSSTSQTQAETGSPSDEQKASSSTSPHSSGVIDAKCEPEAPVVEALRSRIRELENEMRGQGLKCLICMEQYKKPVTSVCCWHVHCEQCWLHTLGAKKLCPQCNMITSPSDLRRIYM
uniref:RING-type domain-containing protein n=1 Tax=Trichogramma kaykai TaxID=54128 RepID=A0ABD2W3Q3_9HYME